MRRARLALGATTVALFSCLSAAISVPVASAHPYSVPASSSRPIGLASISDLHPTIPKAAPKAIPKKASGPHHFVHRVTKGQTLSGIAAHHNTDVGALYRENHLTGDPDVIMVGQVISGTEGRFAPYPTWTAPTPAPVVETPTPASTSSYQAPAQTSEPSGSSGSWSGPWACIAQGESGGNPATETGNGFEGGLQFSPSTWSAYGGTGDAADASIAEQEAVANRVLAAQGWGAWPNTSVACGY